MFVRTRSVGLAHSKTGPIPNVDPIGSPPSCKWTGVPLKSLFAVFSIFFARTAARSGKSGLRCWAFAACSFSISSAREPGTMGSCARNSAQKNATRLKKRKILMFRKGELHDSCHRRDVQVGACVTHFVRCEGIRVPLRLLDSPSESSSHARFCGRRRLLCSTHTDDRDGDHKPHKNGNCV